MSLFFPSPLCRPSRLVPISLAANRSREARAEVSARPGRSDHSRRRWRTRPRFVRGRWRELRGAKERRERRRRGPFASAPQISQIFLPLPLLILIAQFIPSAFCLSLRAQIQDRCARKIGRGLKDAFDKTSKRGRRANRYDELRCRPRRYGCHCHPTYSRLSVSDKARTLRGGCCELRTRVWPSDLATGAYCTYVRTYARRDRLKMPTSSRGAKDVATTVHSTDPTAPIPPRGRARTYIQYGTFSARTRARRLGPCQSSSTYSNACGGGGGKCGVAFVLAARARSRASGGSWTPNRAGDGNGRAGCGGGASLSEQL
ncbi:hypothetical protein FKP32DRAFT_509260 [Trametes sanguinea]|nr:hypothetical protein FKP32DRAFT_509260 [Trametes sanguinea]